MSLPLACCALALLLCASACGVRRGDRPGEDAGTGVQDAGATDAGTPTARTPVLNVPYDPSAPADAQRMLDLYPQPYGERAPVVVWVHGGGWMLGDKANQLADKVTHFASEGVLFVSVNYRLSPPASANPAPDRVMHPVHAQDVARAVAWVKAHASEYGGDPDRVALMGHSAGAHLVSLVATSPEFLGALGLSPSAVRCTATLDTEGYDIPAVMASASATQRALYINAFGTSATTWTAASPLTHVKANAGIGSFLLARRGAADRQARANDFRDALLAAGIPVTVVDVSAYDHEGVNDAVGRPGETVLTPELESFFDSCLR